MGQLQDHWLGRLIFKAMTRTFTKDFSASGDEALIAMVTRSAIEMPWRSLVLMSGGMVGYRLAGFLLGVMNGRLLAAFAALFRGRGRDA